MGILARPSFSVDVKLASVEQMSQNIEGLNSPETLHGLPERIVSSESVVYLVKQFRKLKNLISKSIPEDDIQTLNSIEEYYHQVESPTGLIYTYLISTETCIN